MIFYDKTYNVLCSEVVPEGSQLLSDILLAGKADKRIGIKLGENLGNIHASTFGIRKSLLRNKSCVKKIRIPLTYSNISKSQKIQKKIDTLSQDLIKNEVCIVHTDYKPNNIFIDKNSELIVVDFEFAHIGDPAPECGFLIGIYIHYAYSGPKRKDEYFHAINDFWKTYKSIFAEAGKSGFEKRVIQHTGVQLLARLDGVIKFPTSQKDTLRKMFHYAAEKMIFGKINRIQDIQKLFD